ncbi:MAG: hypothetical protein ACUVWW_07420 [Anaerolineae bacterium]
MSRVAWRQWGCWALLGLLALVLMQGWWPPGVPMSPRRELLPEFSYAWLAREYLRQGRGLVDWSPYEFAGFPWLRFIPFPLYYGIGGLSLLSGLPLEWAFRLCFWGAFTLGGVGAFAFVRRLTGSDLGGLAAGVFYTLVPFHAHITVEVFAHAVGWAFVPWAFLVYERVRRSGNWHGAVVWGALLALFPMVSIEYTLLLSLFLGVYFLWREAEGVCRGRWPWWDSLAFLGTVGVVAAGLSAFVVVPGLLETRWVGIHAKHGSGAALHWDLLQGYAMPPQALLSALLQRLRVTWEVPQPAVYRSYSASAWYLGWIPLGLAGVGVLRPPSRGLGWLLGLLALLGLVRAAGPWLPGNALLFLPAIGKLPPFRSLGLLAFFLAVLVGFGVVALGRRSRSPRWGTVLALGAVALMLAELYGPAASAFVSWPAYFSPAEQEAYAWVQGQEGDFRVWEFPQDHRDEYLFTYSLPAMPRPRFGGYFDNGAPLSMWNLAMAATYPPGALHPLTGPALRLYSTRFVLLRQDRQNYAEALAGLRNLGYEVAFENGEVVVLEDRASLPYARWWSEAVLFVSGEDRLDALAPCLEQGLLLVHAEPGTLGSWRAEDLARFRAVVVDEAVSEEVRERLKAVVGGRLVDLSAWEPGPAARGAEEAVLEWDRPGPTEVRVRVRAGADGWLEIGESWYPHWQAEVDGRPARLLRTDVAFQGVWTPAGEHEVRFFYRWPASIWGSFALSGLGWVGLVVYGLRARRREGRM